MKEKYKLFLITYVRGDLYYERSREIFRRVN